MATAEGLIKIAESYLGIKESPPNSNNVVFNTRFYGRTVSGSAYPWCCAFQWCLFQDAGAPELFYGGGKTASCTTLYHWYRRHGQTIPVGQARPGDLIFFTFNERDKANDVKNHIGLCVKSENGYITTIDGNTGTSSEADGGAVMRRRRAWSYVTGVARPNYTVNQEKLKMTQDQFNEMFEKALAAHEAALSAKPASEWAKEGRDWAVSAGISDGTRPLCTASRQEIWAMLYRLSKEDAG